MSHSKPSAYHSFSITLSISTLFLISCATPRAEHPDRAFNVPGIPHQTSIVHVGNSGGISLSASAMNLSSQNHEQNPEKDAVSVAPSAIADAESSSKIISTQRGRSNEDTQLIKGRESLPQKITEVRPKVDNTPQPKFNHTAANHQDVTHPPDQPVNEIGKKGAPQTAPPDEKVNNDKTSSTHSTNCSGKTFCYQPFEAAKYVRETYAINKVQLADGLPEDIYNQCKAARAISFSNDAKVGDLVFFHNTDDINHDGKNNDWFSHVAIVTDIDANRNVTFTGWYGDTLRTLKMNLELPTTSVENSASDQMRDVPAGEMITPQHFADQLFSGFCALLGDADHFDLIENWTPSTE